MHRVAHRVFGDEQVAQQLREFHEGPHPLNTYPELHALIMAYCLIPLSERPIEGEHAKIEMASVRAHPEPPTVCARVRSPYLLGLTEQSLFCSWGRRMWQSKVFRAVLKPMCQASALKNLTPPQLLQRIYLYGVDQQFESTRDLKAGLQQWELVRNRTLAPPRLALPPVPRLCAEWLRGRLRPGRLLAIPAELAKFVDPADCLTDRGAEPPRLNDVLSLLASEEVVRDIASIEDVVLCKVLNPRPNKRTVQHTWHLGERPDVIRVAVYKPYAAGPSSLTFNPQPDIQDLDLRYLASDVFLEVAQRMCTFAQTTLGCQLAVKEDVLRMLGSDGMDMRLAIPDRGTDAAVAVRDAVLDPVENPSKHPLVSVMQSLVQRNALVEQGTWRRASELRFFSSADVESLIEQGFAARREGEFGEAEYAVSITAFAWRPVLRCSAPVVEFSVLPGDVHVLQQSRLDLLALLHRQGFEGTSNLPKSWTPEAPMQYRLQNITGGTKFYFVCLALRAEILNKGATEILHNAGGSYYRALLFLKDTQPVQALVDAGPVSEESLTALLDEDGATAEPEFRPLLATEDGEEDEGASEQLPVQLAADAAQRAMMRPFELPPILAASPVPGVVHFDNASHSSGILRGWLRCAWNHPRCFKYQQINVAGSRERLIAFLHTWNLLGEAMSREDHTRMRPPDDAVDAQERIIFPRLAAPQA